MFRSRVPALIVGTSLVAAALATTTPAVADDPNPVDTTLCPAVGDGDPTPVWTGDFSQPDQQRVHGFVTAKGTEHDTFTGDYIDTIGSGKDAILLFKLSGSRVTKADGSIDAGIWSGMSGSPVYDEANNLVGAVAYSFNSYEGTDIAGITPAASLLSTTKDESPDEENQRDSVRLNTQQRKAVTASGSRAQSSLKRLEVPRVVVGANANAAGRDYFLPKSRTLASEHRSTDVAAASGTDIPSTIEPGGNVALAYSSGTTTFGAVGTVTAVCGGGDHPKVYAFGHPVDGTGKTDTTLHSASTSTVQADGAGSFVIPKIDADDIEGIGVADGNYGVLGELGAEPAHSIPVTTSTAYGSSEPVESTSYASDPLAISSVVVNQMFNDYAKVLGRPFGAGTVTVTLTVNYKKADGTPGTLPVEQVYSAAEDFQLDALFVTASYVEALQLGSDEDVEITGVTVDSDITSKYFRGLAIDKVGYNKTKSMSPTYLKTGDTITSSKKTAGAPLKLTVSFKKAAGSKAVVPSPVTITYPSSPALPTSGSGRLAVFGGNSYYDEDDYESYYYNEDDDEFYYEDGTIPFDDLVKALADVDGHNGVYTSLTRNDESVLDDDPSARIQKMTVTGSKSFKVAFKK